MHRARVLVVLLAASLSIIGISGAQAQMALQDRAEAAAVTIPDDLTPEMVDGMLARLTDAEIREILRNELVRRAEERLAAEADGIDTLAAIQARLAEMADRIEERTSRWALALANLDDRREIVQERLDRAGGGFGGMILAALLLILAGVTAAMAAMALTRPWRSWLTAADHATYWDRVARTGALLVLELLPVVAFVAATLVAAPWLRGWLGPIWGQVWIYHAGVSWSWAAIIASRRAFAPDAPALRIAPVDDGMAERVHRLLRRATLIGVGGWLLAGLFLNLGLGFPPAIVTVALSGTLVACLLMFELLRKRASIRDAVANVVGRGPEAGAPARIVTAAMPAVLGTYLIVAWVFWLSHWLESGQHRLEGPVGTLIVLFVLPILDRLGVEIVRATIRRQTPAAARFRSVFCGGWRMAMGIVATLVVASLWGLDLLALAKGPEAPGWAGTAFDIAGALLVGYLLWRLVRAALHTETRIGAGGEDADPASVPAATRLNTLIPLCRNALLAFLAIVIAMIVLSSFGLDIGPLIASAGIIGIAIGFGAQSLVRDVFSGVFFLVDDAFRVGEYIELDADTRGEVEAVSVRSLQLRHHRGPVITIPFGELRQITNHNRDWVIYKMSFRMEPETDPQIFKKLVKEVGKEFQAHPEHGPKFLEPLKSQGVYYVDDDSALVMRVKFKCRPRAQFVLRREIYHRLRAVFAENDLHMARRKVEVVGPEDSAGLARAAVSEEMLGPPPAAAL